MPPNGARFLMRASFVRQCGGRTHRLLHRPGRDVGHGGVRGGGGHLQLRENPLLPTHQHDPDRGQVNSTTASKYLKFVPHTLGGANVAAPTTLNKTE